MTRFPSRDGNYKPRTGNTVPSSGYRSGPARGPRYQPQGGGDGNDNSNPGNHHGGGHHGGGHHGGGHHGGYYGGHHYGGYYGFGSPYYGYGYGSYYPFYYGHNYYSPYIGLGFGHSPYYRSRYVRTERVAVEAQGALDLNIKPKDTEVYLNGYFVGTAGDFDGWPRYLWIDEDVHELIFYKEGYETLVREVSIQAQGVVNLKLRMQPGKSIPAEELTRYADEREYRSHTRSQAQPAPEPRQRQRRRYEGPPRDDANLPRARPSAEPAPGEIDQNSETGRLQLTITPPEASVYIDGRFVGIGGELTALGVGLLMDPGEHEIQIFHPEHKTRETSFEVTVGNETKLEIDLTSN